MPLMRAHDRERLRADRPDRARRLGDGRARTCAALHAQHPELEPLYRVLAEATAAVKIVAHDRGAARRLATAAAAHRGLVPTMGAFHARPRLRSSRAARAECDRVVVSLFVNPAQFGDPADLAAYPRDEARDLARRRGRRRRPRRSPRRSTRCTRRASRPGSTSTELGAILEGVHRPGPLPRRRDRLPEALQHRRARTSRTSARRTRSRWR